MTAQGQVVEIDSEGFGRLTGNPGAALRTALLSAGSLVLQSVEYTEGAGGRLALDHRHVGSPHLSFWVDDVPTLRDELVGRGDVVIMSDIEAVVPGIQLLRLRSRRCASRVHRALTPATRALI
jgi:hypothetical protein